MKTSQSALFYFRRLAAVIFPYIYIFFSLSFSLTLARYMDTFFLNFIHSVAYLQDFVFRNVHRWEACGLKCDVHNAWARDNIQRIKQQNTCANCSRNEILRGRQWRIKFEVRAQFNRCKITIALHLFNILWLDFVLENVYVKHIVLILIGINQNVQLI